MSSATVRSTVKSFIESASSEKFVDLTARFEMVSALLESEGIGMDDDWVGIEFIGHDEVPITIPATNSTGKYRETGGIFFHVVTRAKIASGNSILTRGEALRDSLRGQNISGIRVDSVSPLNFGQGAALHFEDGWMSGSFILSYEFDKNL